TRAHSGESMIDRSEILRRADEWQMPENVVEKDYAVGWALWGIATDPILASSWVLKGGMCIKKCYIETYRFSEDLDFTLLPNSPRTVEDLRSILLDMLVRVSAQSGVNFLVQPPIVKARLGGSSIEARIYFDGPSHPPQPPRIKFDLTLN